MEDHRLTPLPPGYDEKVFNTIFKETKLLRHKLARGINPDLYGLTYDDILGYFDSKFIFAFGKNYGKMSEGNLKGRIIMALKNFKCRLLKYSFTHKNSVHQTTDISKFYSIQSHEFIDNTYDRDMESFESIVPVFKKHLSHFAFQVFGIDYFPPLYILEKLPDNKRNKKIDPKLILEYLCLEDTAENYARVLLSRKECTLVIAKIRKK